MKKLCILFSLLLMIGCASKSFEVKVSEFELRIAQLEEASMEADMDAAAHVGASAKLSALTELAAAPAESDEFYINDGGSSKKITALNLMSILEGALTSFDIHADNLPTDINTATTIGSGYIYRAGGTDVPDGDVANDITASNYLPLAGGTLTDNLNIYDGVGSSPAVRLQDGANETYSIRHADSELNITTSNADDRTVDLTNSGAGVMNLDVDGHVMAGVRTSAPASPEARDEEWADCDTWNPSGLNCTDLGNADYLAIYDGVSWIAQYNENGVKFASSIQIASIDLPTLEASDLNDDDGTPGATPFTLIAAELKHKIISNYGASSSSTYTMLEHTSSTPSWNVTFLCEDTDDMIIGVHANDAYILKGTAMDAGEDIVNESCAIGEDLYCYSTKRNVICDSDYAGWTEDTP